MIQIVFIFIVENLFTSYSHFPISRHTPSVYDDDVDLLFRGGKVDSGAKTFTVAKGLVFWAGKMLVHTNVNSIDHDLIP